MPGLSSSPWRGRLAHPPPVSSRALGAFPRSLSGGYSPSEGFSESPCCGDIATSSSRWSSTTHLAPQQPRHACRANARVPLSPCRSQTTPTPRRLLRRARANGVIDDQREEPAAFERRRSAATAAGAFAKTFSRRRPPRSLECESVPDPFWGGSLLGSAFGSASRHGDGDPDVHDRPSTTLYRRV